MSAVVTDHHSWKKEISFFDRIAEQNAARIGRVDPLAFARYGSPRLRRRFMKEFMFRVLGPLEGKRVLDLGCGEGQNSALMALLGAHVIGVDISPGAIENAKKRAALNGVSDRTTFICSPLEAVELPPHTFDLIWGEGILHHLIDRLDAVVERVTEWARPDAVFVCSEPVNRNATLRSLRKLVPVVTEHTPDERPLEAGELDKLRAHLPNLELRSFALLGRLDRFVLENYNYERSSWPRRAVVSAIDALDYALLSLPGVDRLAGAAVLHCKVPVKMRGPEMGDRHWGGSTGAQVLTPAPTIRNPIPTM
jgi:2-polyprenyl-3-methyl-5-hydroxy-6-metoxy-1,4-benzoquinol methylase